MLRSLIALLPLWLCLRAGAAELTVVLDFDASHSGRAVQQMKLETEDIFKNTGIHFNWRDREELGSSLPDELVVIRFKGNCTLDPLSATEEQRASLAFAHNSDGEVLSFSEVECGRVAASVQSAMFGDDFARPDYLMGRALGRVVAHELVHILTRSAAHGEEGVTQAAFTGRDLIGAPLRLSRSEVERLRRAFAPPADAPSEGEAKR
jgi:hypothetical protein